MLVPLLTVVRQQGQSAVRPDSGSLTRPQAAVFRTIGPGGAGSISGPQGGTIQVGAIQATWVAGREAAMMTPLPRGGTQCGSAVSVFTI